MNRIGAIVQFHVTYALPAKVEIPMDNKLLLTLFQSMQLNGWAILLGEEAHLTNIKQKDIIGPSGGGRWVDCRCASSLLFENGWPLQMMECGRVRGWSSL